MKHCLLISVALMVFLPGCQKETEVDQLPQYHPNAQLQQVTTYPLDNDEHPGFVTEVYEYDQNDRVSRIITPGVGGVDDVAQYQSFEYNSDGLASKISTYVANAGVPDGFLLIEVRKVEYSTDGLKASETIENPGANHARKISYEYDGVRLKRSEEFDSKGALEKYTEFEYNDNGTLKKETAFSPTGDLNNYITHAYDGNKIVKSLFYSFKQELVKEQYLLYDANDNLIELKSVNKALWLSSVSYRQEYTYKQ